MAVMGLPFGTQLLQLSFEDIYGLKLTRFFNVVAKYSRG